MTTQVFGALALRYGGGRLHGRGGLVPWLLHLYLWHLAGRLIWSVWRIHAVGPALVLALGAVLIALVVLGGRRGTRRRVRAGGGFGYGTGRGPRDW